MKKKFTFLMALFALMLITQPIKVWAQVSSATPSDGNSYVVAAYVNSTYYALPCTTSNGSTITGVEITLNALNKVNTSDASGKTWSLEEGSDNNEGYYYIKYGSGNNTYYLYKNGTGANNHNFAIGKTNKNYWSFTSTNGGYTVAAIGRGTNHVNIKCSSGTFSCDNSATPIILLEIGDVPVGPTQLTAPTNFSATAGNEQAIFTWDAVANASNYTIFAKNGDTWDNPTTLFDNVSLTNGQYVGTGLTNGTTYICKVRANGDGTNYSNSGLSNEISVTPTGATQYTVTVDNNITGGSVSASPTTAVEGTDIALEATPSDGYGFTSWNVYKTGDQSTTVNVSNNSFEMPDYDVTVSALFTAYTVTLNANSSTSTWNVTMNGGNLPDAVAPCASWSFYGWSTSAVGSQTTTAPTCVNGTGYAPTGNITLYAVYKKTEGGGNTDGTVTLANGVYNSSTPATITWTEDYITILQEKGTSSNAVSNSYISNPRWYQNHVITMTPTSTVNSITITQYDGKYGLEESGTSITNGSASVDNHVVTITPTNGNQAVVITMDAQARISAISVNYVGSTTYYHSNPDCTETVATPTFDVNEGTYYESQIIIIECETAGASIYYTLKGEEPTSTESVTNFLYDENEGVEISLTTTLKAKAFKTGMNPSATRTATYTIIHDVAEPTLAESQLFTTDTYSVAITVPANTTVYYTTDGTAPTNASTQYTAAFNINATTTVKAIAYDGDGCASDVVTATYTRAYTLAGAKALYEGSDVTNVTISLNGVQFIAKSGSSTYMQQGTTGLMIYGSHSQDLTKGDRFTAGTVTGTITKYGENLELSISSGAFANVAKTAGTLTASATGVEITDVTDYFSTYESRYVSLTSLDMDLDNLELSDGTNTLAIYDPFNVLSGAIQPDDDVIVTGVVTSYYKNSNTTYQIIPLAKSGITTGVAATLPTFTPAGGADAAHAVSTETVIVTPATSTTVTYSFGSSAYGEIDAETEITVPSTEATELEVVASRDFYTDNSVSYYYMSAAASYTVYFYENEELTYYEENVVSGTSLAISSTTAPNGYEFMGWTTAPISGVQAGAPATLYNGSVTVEDDMNLYAVYALEGEASVTYTLVGAGDVTEGTYIIGALRSTTATNDFYFADGSITTTTDKDMNTNTTAVTINEVSNVRQITELPADAMEFVFSGNATDGFSICKVGTSAYLGYTSTSSRRLAFGSSYNETLWKAVAKDSPLLTNGIILQTSDYKVSENSTAQSAIRGYGNSAYRALYLFKKAETPAYSNYCTTITYTIYNDDETRTTPILANEIVTVPNGTVLTLNTTNGGTAANLIIEDGGQLICNNSVQATVKKSIIGHSTGGKGGDVTTGWYFIATTAAAGTTPSTTNGILDATPANYDLYYYDEPTHYWINYKNYDGNADPGFISDGGKLLNGKGYLYSNASNAELSFEGATVAGNQEVELPLSCSDDLLRGFNLVGNPFTRNITSSDMQLATTTDKTTTYSAVTAYYVVENGAEITSSSADIKPGRGFMVQANAANQKLVFNHTSKAETYAKPSFIIIEAGNAEFMDRALVQIGGGNTLRKMTINDQVSHVYVINDGKDYAAATVDELKGEMPVIFDAVQDGQYTISVSTDNVEMGYMHLVDMKNGMDIDLMATPSYTFEAKANDNAGRFRLLFRATGVEENMGDSEDGFAFVSNGQIVVTGEGTLRIVDMLGRTVGSYNTNERISTEGLTPGVYVLQLIGGEKTMTQKIVVR